MKIISNGQELHFHTRGLAGPDGNPIGTVISYMGFTAPKDYLVCDGAIYSIASYPDLSNFIQEQFGTKNYFGGDGVDTFAIPDMRNLFLRGYHGNTAETLSGNVGERQDGTSHPHIMSGNQLDESFAIYGEALNASNVYNAATNTDTAVYAKQTGLIRPASTSNVSHSDIHLFRYTSRPVNMAVLYCIKAVESVPYENAYSTEENLIGRWIDGKPLYRKVLSGTLVSEVTNILIDTQGFEYKFLNGSLLSDTSVLPINYYTGPEKYWCHSYIDVSSSMVTIEAASAYINKKYVIELLYTKAEGSSSVMVSSIPESMSAPVSSTKIVDEI